VLLHKARSREPLRTEPPAGSVQLQLRTTKKAAHHSERGRHETRSHNVTLTPGGRLSLGES
jgi:hypothetical protein